MKVLLTGASSFTGYWFAEPRGVPCRCASARRAPRLSGRGARGPSASLSALAEIVEAGPFGSARFLGRRKGGGFDLLCHHAARAGDYRSPDFGVAGALAENTANLRAILEILKRGGLSGIVLTGSVFEQDEGAGGTPLVASSRTGCRKA
jgi:UDP-glucose 4-epimerase